MLPSSYPQVTNKFAARKIVGTADLFSDDVDDETRRQVTEAEKNLEKVFDVACDLEKIGLAMEGNLVDTTEQINRIAKKTEKANERVHKQNFEVQKTTRNL